jgi:xylulokinase
MFRALIEGIAYGTRHVTDTFADVGQPPAQLFAVGGGTKNALWLQATSDITGIDQQVREKTVGASYGNAFLAALAIGVVKRSDIEQWNPVQKCITSQPKPVYERHYQVFLDLYKATKHLMRQL